MYVYIYTHLFSHKNRLVYACVKHIYVYEARHLNLDSHGGASPYSPHRSSYQTVQSSAAWLSGAM